MDEGRGKKDEKSGGMGGTPDSIGATLAWKAIITAFIAGLLFSVSTVHAQTAEQNTYARFIRTGAEQIKKGDYQAARDSFEGALRITDSEAAATSASASRTFI